MVLSSNVVGYSNDENNFPHKLWLTNAMHKFQDVVKLLQVAHQLLNYL